jgi:hypothetical protein
MVAVKLNVVIGEDRRLVIDLPDDVPVGPAEITIQPEITVEMQDEQQPEALWNKLYAAGIVLPRETVTGMQLTVEERQRIGRLAPNARPSEALISEDRTGR